MAEIQTVNQTIKMKKIKKERKKSETWAKLVVIYIFLGQYEKD